MHGIVIGRPAGVEIRIHPSILVIFALIVLGLATGPFRFWHPDWAPGMSWLLAIAAALLFVGSVLIHELAHTLVALRFGLPVDHITLFLFGGVSNIEREPPQPKIEFLVSVIGPLTSFGLGLLFLLLGALLAGPILQQEDPAVVASTLGPWSTLFGWLGTINLVLGAFNLLPAFPLDGGRILRSALWAWSGDQIRATRWASAIGRGFGYLFVACGVLMFFGFRVPIFGAGPIAGLWLGFIGWFLAQAANGVYYQTLVTRALGDLQVADLMTPEVDPIPADLPVSALVERFLRQGRRAFPVVERGEMVGQVGIEEVRQIQREQWSETPASAIMIPRDRVPVVAPTAPATEALRTLGDQRVDQVPVVEGSGHLLGSVRREDLVRWLQLRADLPA